VPTPFTGRRVASPIVKRSILIVAFCVALFAAGCGSSSDSSSTGSTEPSGSTSSTESGNSAETTSTAKKTKPTVTVPKGISPKKYAIKEIEEGSGATAKAGDKVTVQYVGVGYDSEEEFDSSWSRNEPFSFTLGAGEVIKGWDKGVEGMKVGGRRELLLPPDLAYGAEGSPPSIGPNETLIFTIDLLSVE
jgi:peptidylprolyl isomerase